jgi:hypothetical protein
MTMVAQVISLLSELLMPLTFSLQEMIMGHTERKYPNLKNKALRRNVFIAVVLCLGYLLGKHFQITHPPRMNIVVKVKELKSR